MKYLNSFAPIFCAAVMGLSVMTSCEGGDLYNILAPDWLSARADSIANSKNQGEEELEGMMEDVYTVGAVDFSSGWWAVFSKYYQIPENGVWNAQFNLNINPSAPNTYKNFALIITNDVDRGGEGYQEYGAIRFDTQPTTTVTRSGAPTSTAASWRATSSSAPTPTRACRNLAER